jgi:hypothetical protein
MTAGTRARALIQQERDLLRQRLEAAEAAAAGAQKEKTTLSKQASRVCCVWRQGRGCIALCCLRADWSTRVQSGPQQITLLLQLYAKAQLT